MVSRSFLTGSLLAAAGIGTTSALILMRRARRARPDLFPAYNPLHRRLDPGQPQQVAVIYNPSKARAEWANRIITAELGFANWPKARFYETEIQDPGSGMARQALADGANLVLAVGGDGTIRAVANGLAGSGIPLGLVPLGTGNLLARNLDLNVADLHACINIALHGRPRAIDMIQLRLKDPQALEPINYLVMGGAGFDAQIMTDTREDLKAKIGWLAYFEASSRHMFTRRRPADISVDGGPVFRRKIRTVLVANCGKIQGGVNLTSVAELSDGQLEVVVLTPRTLLSWLRMTAQFLLRKPKVRRPVVEHFVGKQVQVSFPHSQLPVEVDGDVLGESRGFEAQVLPGVLKVNTYPDDLQIRSLSDFMVAKEELVEQQVRWWQRLLRL